jgi:NMD protein affecting ribosome stability and mRNA decay
MRKNSGRIPDCHPNEKHRAHGLCQRCYLQKYNKSKNPEAHPYGVLPTCHPDRPHKARGLCQECYVREPDRAAYDKAYRAKFARRDQLKHKYNLSIEDYEALVQKQNGLCAICKQPPRGKMTRLSVDHDHTTGHVRGLLCITCNRVLGFFENAEWHWAANAYLAAPTS